MLIYKYRDTKTHEALSRVLGIITDKEVWCSAAEPFNDSDEFKFQCDFTVTLKTCQYLARVLMHYRGYSAADALLAAHHVIKSDQLEEISSPIFQSISAKCRAKLGVSCFGMTATNETLWKRYGGDGDGVCIELDVSDTHLLDVIYPVGYVDHRCIHVDLLLRAVVDPKAELECYTSILTTKTKQWAPEEELRLVSKRPNVSLKLINTRVSRVVMGNRLNQPATRALLDWSSTGTDRPSLEHAS
jgi:hypothetical protein